MMSIVTVTEDLAVADVAPPQPEEAGLSESHLPRLHLLHRASMRLFVELAQAKRSNFELLDAKPVTSIPEPRCCYTHINFTARSSQGGFAGTSLLR
ncbi:hypothetical protein HU200_008073 [Digitaria exilis]|uniref:Uncharacterized protein n=1 Tax=Digitaria exilis TaxID=1010633 RepID=A0A835KP88_9POAL|nr:hypothetical protein HU200_008073 [Digitaria exilis]